MREIKFRAWDGKEMYSGWSFEDIYAGRDESSVACGDSEDRWREWVSPNWEEAHIMQYTGLNDKYGKEIYEGDIVKARNKEGEYKDFIGKIEWCGSCCLGYRVQFIGIGNNENITNFPDIEIIGNIYANPELTKE